MNGGIVGALVALNTVFVMIMAYFMFKESFGKIKLLSVLLLVSSVVLVTLFPPDNITSKDDMFITGASGAGHIKIINRLTEDEFFFNQVLMIGGGLVASVSFGSQLLVFKRISYSTKDTFGIGFGFLFSCGILGLISLVIQSVRDFETILELPLIEMVGPLSIGLFTALGIVLANIGAGIGIAGISNSII
jgi:drug/metabolite transporter (DMT)-like permease